MKRLITFTAGVALTIAAIAIGNLLGQTGSLSSTKPAAQKAYVAGEVYWICKQVCPDLNERHVKAAIFNRIRNERIGATVNEVETAFEAGAQSAGESFSVSPTPAPGTGASTPQP